MDSLRLKSRFSRAAGSILGSSSSTRLGRDGKASTTFQASLAAEAANRSGHVQFSDAHVGVSIYKFGNERAAEDKWNEALLAWQNALEIFKASLGPKHVFVARALNKIGVAFYMLKETYYAYDSFEKALALQQEILPPGDEQITRTLRNLNNLLSDAREESEGGRSSEDEEEEEEDDDDKDGDAEAKEQIITGCGRKTHTVNERAASTKVVFKEGREDRAEIRQH